MKKKDNSGIAGIIFGIVFVAIGILLFSRSRNAAVIRVISVVDAAFGLVLIISGIVSVIQSGRASQNEDGLPAYDEAASAAADDLSGESSFDRRMEKRADFDETPAAEPEQEVIPETAVPEMTVEELAKREAELRAEAKRTASEANKAADEADEAVERARLAEERLNQAEQDVRDKIGIEQQAALEQVDKLAVEAMELSKEAAVARRKAKAAANLARKTRDEHMKAMDAVANAMSDDEDFD